MVRREYAFYVYILSSRSRNLYVGMITSLMRRVLEHRAMKPGAHTAHYNIMRLIYFERYQYVDKAIARENELKSWTRAKKVALVETVNPTWEDLAAGW
jgi:putative endonuclease